MRLNFIADKAFVLQHVLKNYSKNPLFWKLKRKVWDLDKPAYYLLSQNIEPILFEAEPIADIQHSVKNLDDTLRTIYATNEFKRIFSEVERHSALIAKQWESNYEASLSHMEAITKIDFKAIDRNINVFTSHPLLQKGRSYVENNTIAFTHEEDWGNYSTVYLWHEIMHYVTFDNKNCDQNLMHALIELTCDNELRIRLNGGGKYFMENDIPVGHKYLARLEKKLLPDWKKYLRGVKNIFEFEKEMRAKHKDESLLTPFSSLGWWAEWH